MGPLPTHLEVLQPFMGIPLALLIDLDLGFSLFNLASPPFSPLSMAQYSLFNYELVKNEKNRSEKGTQRNT